MQPRERIARMEADGRLSPSQAELLRGSLKTGSGGADAVAAAHPSGRRRRPLGAFAALALLAVLAAILWAASDAGPAAVQDVTETLNQPGGLGEMNRSLSAVLAVALLLVAPLLIWTWLHNSLVAKEERVAQAWAQTESNFQRRADLIPALVDTVSRYLKHEAETLGALAEARGGPAARLSGALDELIRSQGESAQALREAGGAVVEDEALLRRLYQAQALVGGKITGLYAAVEAYPELSSSDQFLELQAQIEGTENRINVARLRFNEAVGDYNGTIRMLPWSLPATLGKFQRKAYFRSQEEARNAPELRFQ